MHAHDRVTEVAHRMQLHVAIDGPASAGKSTVGKAVARKLDCPSLDTGVMYRAVTARALERAVPVRDGPHLARLAEAMNFEMNGSEGLLLDGRAPGDELRTPEVDSLVSSVSAHPEVRAVLVRRQRELARGRCFVMIGRDIGSVVLPQAPIKFWVTASPEERARRRVSEYLPGAAEYSEQELTELLRSRDLVDSTRSTSPSRPAPDAVVLMTDGLSVEDVVDAALKVIESVVARLSHEVER